MGLIKTESDLIKMREPNKILKDLLILLGEKVKAGVSTLELDELFYSYVKKYNAEPSFLGYNGYPASLCISLDNEVVHGIPRKDKIIQENQIVSIDAGVYLNGFHADAARSYLTENASEDKKQLVKVTEESFFKGIENIKEGSHLYDIGAGVQEYAESYGYSVVRALVGHGIGKRMHEEPSVPNYGRRGTGMKLRAGMTLAIEPMINMGGYDVKVLSDGWTVVTLDGKPSAHYENTVAITKDGVEILTL